MKFVWSFCGPVHRSVSCFCLRIDGGSEKIEIRFFTIFTYHKATHHIGVRWWPCFQEKIVDYEVQKIKTKQHKEGKASQYP